MGNDMLNDFNYLKNMFQNEKYLKKRDFLILQQKIKKSLREKKLKKILKL